MLLSYSAVVEQIRLLPLRLATMISFHNMFKPFPSFPFFSIRIYNIERLITTKSCYKGRHSTTHTTNHNKKQKTSISGYIGCKRQDPIINVGALEHTTFNFQSIQHSLTTFIRGGSAAI